MTADSLLPQAVHADPGVPHQAIKAPASWMRPETHFLDAMRSPWYRALVQMQDAFTSATVAFWTHRGVRYGHLPVTTSAVSSPIGLGSDSQPVAVDMFGIQTFLADSMQFALEYLCRLSATGAYYLMPSFRGETSDATHLSQFMHSEAELPGGLDGVITIVEEYLRCVTSELVTRCGSVIREVAGGLDHAERLLDDPAPFRCVTFDDAADILSADCRWVRNEGRWRTLTRAGEQELIARCGQFLWVTHWDHLAVPFYQAVDEAGRALNADLLFGPGEVVGAGQRHTTADEVTAALHAHDVGPAPYQWYTEMKKVAPMTTSGFGLGVERYLMWLLRHDDIRDLQILPRENGRSIVP
jgi:asparaginyl-tRNA synthetase